MNIYCLFSLLFTLPNVRCILELGINLPCLFLPFLHIEVVVERMAAGAKGKKVIELLFSFATERVAGGGGGAKRDSDKKGEKGLFPFILRAPLTIKLLFCLLFSTP